MYTQTEGDFWKEKLVLMQRQNMRLSGGTLNLSDASKKITELKIAFPKLETTDSSTENYISCDFTVFSTLKVRLFIQNQTKITFLGKTTSGWEKLCDAKFPNDPFPLLAHFFSHRAQYEEELKNVLQNQRRFEKQQKITGEMIKALLKRSLDGKGLLWHLEPKESDFSLIIEENHEKKEFTISFKNFSNDIKKLPF